MKTHIATEKEIKQDHKFHVIDAEDIVLGRLASTAARLLTGKHKPIYSPFMDTGDHVIVVNADKIRLTGNKNRDKQYIRHTLHPGGLKRQHYGLALQKQPEKMITKAVWGMLPKNRLGRQMLKKLRVYRGPEHPHTANKPEKYEL